MPLGALIEAAEALIVAAPAAAHYDIAVGALVFQGIATLPYLMDCLGDCLGGLGEGIGEGLGGLAGGKGIACHAVAVVAPRAPAPR